MSEGSGPAFAYPLDDCGATHFPVRQVARRPRHR